MRVAVVYTGLMRCFEQAYAEQKRFMFNVPSTYNFPVTYDFYFHTWSERGFYTGKGYLPEENGFVRLKAEDRGFHPGGDPITPELIRSVYKNENIVDIMIEEFDDMQPIFDARKENFPNAFTRPKNTIAMFYKIQKGMERFGEVRSVDYDMVMRMRPDILPQGPIWTSGYNPNAMLVYPGGNKLGKGVGDGVNISSQENIYRFSSAYSNLEDLYSVTGISCPHLYTEIMANSLQLPLEFIRSPSTIAHSPHGAYQEPEGGMYIPQ